MRFYKQLFCLLLAVLTAGVIHAQVPAANFTASTTSGCPPLAVNFNASSSTGNPTTYTWNLGNGSTIPNTNSMPSTIYTTPGTYTVTLTVANSSGSNTKTITNYIIVRDTPVVNFGASPVTGCPPLNVQFTNTTVAGGTGANTYEWFFGDAATLMGNANPSHKYNSGIFNVTLKVTNSFGCQRALTKPALINVLTKPATSFTASKTVHCDAPATPTFTVATTSGTAPYTYEWDFGDGTGTITSSAPTINHTFAGPKPASYNIRLIAIDANGCRDTMTKSGYINIVDVRANFTLPTSACVGTDVSFTNTSTPGATSSAWDFGDLTTGSGNSTLHKYHSAGTKTVTLTNTFQGCQATVSKTINILPQPNLDFKILSKTPCPAPVNVQFVPTGTATAYQWDYEIGTSTANSPTVLFTNGGFYTIKLIGTDANGCVDTITKVDSLKIYNSFFNINVDSVGGCAPMLINFGTSNETTIPDPPGFKVNYPFSNTSYIWQFADVSGTTTKTTSNPNYTWTTAGDYKVTVAVTTSNGCTFYDTTIIKIGLKPTAGFTYSPPVQCLKQPVTFINTSTSASTLPTTYLWDFGDGGSATTKDAIHKYDSAATWTVILTTYSNQVCKDTFKVVNAVKINPPKARFETVNNCDTPLKMIFNLESSTGYESFKWFFGDGNTNTTSTIPSHTYASLGTYQPYLVTYNATTGCSDTMKKTITLMSTSVNFTADDTTVCLNTQVQMTPTLTGGPATRWVWYVGVDSVDSARILKYNFNTTGYHSITVKAIDAVGCSRMKTRTNYILVSKPIVAFSANPTGGCIPLNVNFTDQSTPTPGSTLATRTWDFGNGTAPSGTTISRLFPVGGEYDIKLIVTDNNGCKDSLTKEDYIKAYKPDADFEVNDVAACPAQSLTFTNKTLPTGASAQWWFGDGGTLGTYDATYAYQQAGTYDVQMIVTDAQGCKDTVIKPAYVTITKPKAAFGFLSDSIAVCPPLLVKFDNKSTGLPNLTYEWYFGNSPTSSPITNPSELYFNPGVFKPMLIVKDGEGCRDTARRTVNILGYAGALTYTPLAGCAPLTVTFNTALVNIPSVIWDFNDGTTLTSSAQTLTHTYTTAGKYMPKLVVTDNAGCTNTSAGKDTITVDDVVADFITTPLCEGQTVRFTDTSKSFYSNINGWSWTFHDNQTQNIRKPTKYYPTVGSYSVKLVATNSRGCTDTLERNIYINPLPVISASRDTLICLNDAATLIGTGGVSYTWSPTPDLSCVNCNPTLASPPIKTEFTVIGTDANGCTNTDKVIVSIKTKVEAGVGPGGEICDDEPFALRAWGAHRYEWTPANSLAGANTPEPIATPHNTTKYMSVAFEGSCIPDTNFVDVIVHPKPTVNASGTQTIIAGGTASLQSSGNLIEKFAWTPAESLSCSDCAAPIASPMKTTIYNVRVYSDFGCSDSAKVTITVLCDQSQLFIPNTFSPNGDGQNDYFYPRGVGLDNVKSFRVYNRWGEVVYQKSNFVLNDATNGWDGTYKNAQLSPDVFVYILEAVCEDGQPIQWKGDINLIR